MCYFDNLDHDTLNKLKKIYKYFFIDILLNLHIDSVLNFIQFSYYLFLHQIPLITTVSNHIKFIIL
jgi:hypothetical protein